MKRIQVIRALSGMRDWFDQQLEMSDDEILKSGKDVCTDAIEMLRMDAIIIHALQEEDEEDEDGHCGAEVDEYGQGHGAGDPGGRERDPDDGRGGANRG